MKIRSVGKDVDKLGHLIVGENVNGAAIVKNVQWFLKMISIESSNDSNCSPSDIT